MSKIKILFFIHFSTLNNLIKILVHFEFEKITPNDLEKLIMKLNKLLCYLSVHMEFQTDRLLVNPIITQLQVIRQYFVEKFKRKIQIKTI